MLIIAVIAAPLLVYVPGWIIREAILGSQTPDPLEIHYERVIISVLLNGWLALLLVGFGVFSLWLHLSLLLFLSELCAGWFTRRRSGGQDRISAMPHHRGGAKLRLIPGGQGGRTEILAFALVGAIALLLVVPPFETILGARDAGVYANTGFAIARTGTLVQHDELIAGIGTAMQSPDETVRAPAEQAFSNLLGVQNPNRYIATRMRASGFFIHAGEAATGRVVPQFLHLFPIWIALLTSALGLHAGLFAAGLMGVLGAWSVGMLGRRLAGSTVGLLAFLFLALNSVQVWFGRYSTSETTAQFLTFAGLYCFAKWQQTGQERTTDAWGRTLVNPQVGLYAALAGIAFGQLTLTRIDFFLVIGPVLLYLLYRWISRRWQIGHTALALGLGAMLLHAGLHVVFIARAYFFDTGFDRFKDYALTAYLALPFLTEPMREAFVRADAWPGLAALWQEIALLGLGIAGMLAIRRWSQPLRWLEAGLSRWRQLLLGGAAIGIVALASYGYLVRPRIIDSDILFNTRQGWSDPLARDPRFVREDVNEWRMSIDAARTQTGVVLYGDQEYAATAVDEAATAELREQLRAERGPWHGPFSNQTFNWMRLQGYVGAPIALLRTFYDDGQEHWRTYAQNEIPPGVQPPTGLPVQEKDIIPLANFARVGWYLSPLGVVLGVVGFALWWWRGMSRAAWLFLVLGLIGTFFWVRQTYGTSDQTYIYILRRFVPVSYPAFSLGMAYALVALGSAFRKSAAVGWSARAGWLGAGLARFTSACMIIALVAFFIWTGQTIYRHGEYAGAIAQIEALADQFDANDIILLRGGAPEYSAARDIPDIVATPLRFAFGVEALTVKGSQPGAYADLLADQARRWQASGHDIYVMLSANGGDFALPGFDLQQTGDFTLQVAEFEQLTDQKPHNISSLSLPFAIYRLSDGSPGQLGTLANPLAAPDFAAQVQGFYLPEVDSSQEASVSDANAYAWTNGDAVLRLPWPEQIAPRVLELRAASGERPAHLGPARVCLALLAETRPWPETPGEFTPLECLTLESEMETYQVPLPEQTGQPARIGSMLLHLESETWVPADEDPRQNDRRTVGIQFGQLTIHDDTDTQP